MLDNDAIATVYKITEKDHKAQSVENAATLDPHLDFVAATATDTSAANDPARDSVKNEERVKPFPHK